MSDYVIKALQENDFDDALKLNEYAFGYTLSEEDKEKRKQIMAQHQTVFGSFAEQQLAAKVHIWPLQLFLGDKVIEFGGIAGVATWPEFRRKGHVNKLLQESFKEMKDTGLTLSMLHPFLIRFYRQFGYELTHYTYNYQLTSEDIPNYKPSGYCRRVNFTAASNILADLYQKEAIKYGLMMNRSNWWWKERRINKQDTICISYDQAGNPNGYLISTVKNKELQIKEFIHHSLDAFQTLLRWIKNHDSMIDTIKIDSQPNELFAFFLDNPRVPLKKQAYFMTRIVDFENFIKQYPYIVTPERIVIQFAITDDFAPWNAGTWNVIFEEKNCINVAKNEQEEQIDIRLKANIQTVTALLLGSESLDVLRNFSAIDIEEYTTNWNEISEVKKPHLLDFF